MLQDNDKMKVQYLRSLLFDLFETLRGFRTPFLLGGGGGIRPSKNCPGVLPEGGMVRLGID